MKTDPYKLSFTGAALSLSGSITIAEVYLQLRDWEAVKEKIKNENLLQARTQSSIQRVFQELAPRLQESLSLLRGPELPPLDYFSSIFINQRPGCGPTALYPRPG